MAKEREKLYLRGSQAVTHPWFSGLKAVLDYFCENVELQKRVRIVIDYDPQKGQTDIRYYRANEKQSQAEAER